MPLPIFFLGMPADCTFAMMLYTNTNLLSCSLRLEAPEDKDTGHSSTVAAAHELLGVHS